MNLTNLWWSLPPQLTKLIQPKGKTSITFKAYKEGEQWYFNAPLLLTWKESLMMPKQLDEMAEGAQSLWLKASIYKEEGATLKIWYEGDDTWDQTASIYIDPAGQTIWLCGWLPWYFGYKPENLWISKAKG